MRVLAVIPARAGSKGIPRKNVRMMCGKPLIVYTINNAIKSKYITDIIVSTDDEEIKSIAENYKEIQVIDRPASLCEDHVTLDSVIYHACCSYCEIIEDDIDIVITLQATSPLLKTTTLDDAIMKFINSDIDTIISAINEPHLAWSEKNDVLCPLYKERLNRQYLPVHYKETGAFVITKKQFVKENSRIGNVVSVYEMQKCEAIDIDTAQDWVLAEAEINRKHIIFRVDGYKEIGMGHIYRALLLAYNLTHHDIIFVLSQKSNIGIQKIKKSFFNYYVVNTNQEFYDLLDEMKPDILINDILDTDKVYMLEVKNRVKKIVNFEDVGEGACLADSVINALYEKKSSDEKFFYGKDYYCIKDEFLLAKKKEFSEQVKNILVLFGGTDPSNLTKKVLDAIMMMNRKDIKYTFILGLGYDKKIEIQEQAKMCDLDIEISQNVTQIAKMIEKADLAISSQGRTMFELASLAIPTILLAQNERELLHGFGNLENGFINLGLGKQLSSDSIERTLECIIDCPQIRNNMRTKMEEIDLLHGVNRVLSIILGE